MTPDSLVYIAVGLSAFAFLGIGASLVFIVVFLEKLREVERLSNRREEKINRVLETASDTADILQSHERDITHLRGGVEGITAVLQEQSKSVTGLSDAIQKIAEKVLTT